MDGSKTKNLRTISQISQMAGLMVEIIVGNQFNTLSSFTGVHVFINNNSVRVNSLIGFGAAPGTYNYIELGKTVTELLPKPYNDCVEDTTSINGFDSDLFRALINANYSYSQENCYYVYLQSQIISGCDCYYTVYMNYNNFRKPCKSVVDLRCAIDVVRSFVGKDFKVTIQNICPLECTSYMYSYSISSNGYPAEYYAENLIKQEKVAKLFPNPANVTTSDLKQSILALNFFYPSLRYTSVTQVPQVTIVSLISNIGGTLGVFLVIRILISLNFYKFLL
jgi:hypothetical protein